MPAKSKAQRKFMGMVRATQKGEMKNPSPELKRAAGDMSAKAVNKYAKTKEKNLPDKVEESVQNNKVDLVLKTGVNNVLKQDNKDYDRGLLAQVNKDGSYDVAYWYDKYEKYPVEVVIDGKTCAKDAKNIHIKYHPELKNKDKDQAKEDMKEYMIGYGAVVSSARPGSTSHSDAKGKYVAKTAKKKKTVKEEGAPTMSTGSTAQAAGFSGDSDPNGPTAGLDEPLGGVGRPLKGRRFKCKTKKNGTIKCGPSTTKESYTRNEGRYFPFKVEFTEFEGETDFVFYGRSVSDVRLRLRSIYRPEKFDKIKITRLTPSTVLKYYWDKRQGAM